MEVIERNRGIYEGMEFEVYEKEWRIMKEIEKYKKEGNWRYMRREGGI